MPHETKQQDRAEMPDEFQFQVNVDRYRRGLRRLKKTCSHPTRMLALSLRSENRQENLSGVEWLYTSIVHDLRWKRFTIHLKLFATDGKRWCTRFSRASDRQRVEE
jgi:hypothetical protein